MMFGDEDVFGLRCVAFPEPNAENFVGVSLYVAGLEVGNAAEFSPAGVLVHSAEIFLSYSGLRETATSDGESSYNLLYSTIYGDEWKVGVGNQYRARYAVHEIFDLSVGDLGWIVFLTDSVEANSRLLVGKRDQGYVTCCDVSRGRVEQVLEEFLLWLDSFGLSSKTRH